MSDYPYLRRVIVVGDMPNESVVVGRAALGEIRGLFPFSARLFRGGRFGVTPSVYCVVMAAVSGDKTATATLGAATEDVVTLNTAVGASKMGEVTNHGDDGTIYVRADGVAATVAGDECTPVLASERLGVGLSSAGTISVIGAGAATYTVAVIN